MSFEPGTPVTVKEIYAKVCVDADLSFGGQYEVDRLLEPGGPNETVTLKGMKYRKYTTEWFNEVKPKREPDCEEAGW
jgi:hypothetical protein